MGGKPGENLIRGYIFSVRASYSSVSSSRQPDVYSEASFRFSAQSISDSHRFSTRYLLSCQRVFRLFMSYANTHTRRWLIKSESNLTQAFRPVVYGGSLIWSGTITEICKRKKVQTEIRWLRCTEDWTNKMCWDIFEIVINCTKFYYV